MLRHMQDIHKIIKNPFKKNLAYPQTQGSNSSTIQLYGPNSVEKQASFTPLERTWRRIGEVLKASSEYMKSFDTVHENIALRGQINFCQREIRELTTNNWILPHSAIQGLSGYLCRRCFTFDFVNIQHIGYDKTMVSRHMCDEQKVKTSKDISMMNLSDLWATWDQYNSAAAQMLNALNFIMPGKKYLIAEDMSSLFNFLESLMLPDFAKILLGVPDRFHFHIVRKEQISDWINRIVANMGKKTSVEDFEIKDFLRRVTSTYAIFEIPHDKGLKRILVKIVK
jgi:hypothetical protein